MLNSLKTIITIPFSLLLLLFFTTCNGAQVNHSTVSKSKYIMDNTTNFVKIYSKKVNPDFDLEMLRQADDTSVLWKINLVSGKEKRTIKKDSIGKEENGNENFRLAIHPKFFDAFQILHVKHHAPTNRLFILIDRFGKINLHEFSFNGKSLENINEKRKIEVGTYFIRPMDVDLLLAGGARLQISENDVLVGISIMKNKYYRVNLNTETGTSLIFDYYAKERETIKDEKSYKFISTGDLSREKKTTKIIENFLKKTDYSNQPWVYHFFIEGPSSVYSFEKNGKRNGRVHFFTTINGNKKVLIYNTSAAKEWVITDYKELSEGESEEDIWNKG